MTPQPHIYRTECLPTGQYYIGASIRAPESSYLGSGMERAGLLREYPRSAFRKTVLAYADCPEDLPELEAQFIAGKQVADPLCLNKRRGGGGLLSDEARARHKAGNKRRWADREERERISEILCNSQAHKNAVKSPECRRKMSASARRRCSDPEQRRKMSEAARRQFADPEQRRRMSEIKIKDLGPEVIAVLEAMPDALAVKPRTLCNRLYKRDLAGGPNALRRWQRRTKRTLYRAQLA